MIIVAQQSVQLSEERYELQLKRMNGQGEDLTRKDTLLEDL